MHRFIWSVWNLNAPRLCCQCTLPLIEAALDPWMGTEAFLLRGTITHVPYSKRRADDSFGLSSSVGIKQKQRTETFVMEGNDLILTMQSWIKQLHKSRTPTQVDDEALCEGTDTKSTDASRKKQSHTLHQCLSELFFFYFPCIVWTRV